jgi:hypothetical protein
MVARRAHNLDGRWPVGAGVGNTVGNFAGILTGMTTGWILDAYGPCPPGWLPGWLAACQNGFDGTGSRRHAAPESSSYDRVVLTPPPPLCTQATTTPMQDGRLSSRWRLW